MRSSAERSPTFVDPRAAGLYSGAAVAAPEIHTAVAVDAVEEERRAASRERDQQKPLTAKEKRRLEMGQKEVWQYVGRKIFTDKIFLRRRKKKGSSSPEEDKEELKVSFFVCFLLSLFSSVLRIRDVYFGTLIQIFFYLGSRIPDPLTRVKVFLLF